MSELATKLRQEATTEGTRARATLAQLRGRWGFVEPTTPDEVLIRGMRFELWKRISGLGTSASYELVEGGP